MDFKDIINELDEIEEYDFYSITLNEIDDLKNKIDELEEMALTLNELSSNDTELAEIFNKIEELRYIIDESESRYNFGEDEDYF